MKKLKILELTNYSKGICGVWSRVKQESVELSKRGYEVAIFSSNKIKGSDELAESEEFINNIKIKRFPAFKIGGESFMFWSFEKQALKFNPDIIIAHSYRMPHTLKALKIAKKLKSKVFLVTHAPFVDEDTRSFFSKIAVYLYDKFIGPLTINNFDRIIAITKWEIPYLEKLNSKKEKIVIIPNGIPNDFFTKKYQKENKSKILFLGRVSPIKNVESLIFSLKNVENKNIFLDIIGPAEKEYLIYLKKLTKENNLKNRVFFKEPIYDLNKKIAVIDTSYVFVLPSKREAMPQSLIEAMSRKKIVIASKNKGTLEIIKNNHNGYIFNDTNDLSKKLNFVFKKNQYKIKQDAKKTVEKFNWDNIIKKLENLF